jgi:carboxyl-terminal processing protease
LATTFPRCPRRPFDARYGAVLILLTLLFASPGTSSAQTIAVDRLVRQAEEAEKQRDWLEACRIYDEVLHRDRTHDDLRIRTAYQRCLRRFHLVHRHQDKTYRDALERVTPAQALELYVHVLETIGRVYTDRQKSGPGELFAQGLEELRLALDEPVFLREYFSTVSPKLVGDFQKKLTEWRGRKIANRNEASEQVRAVGRAAQQMGFGTRPLILTLIALEFVGGACNALDEYTFFLSPSRYREVQAALRGRPVAIGVELEMVEGQLLVRRVYPHSPAEEVGLMSRDRLVRIDGHSTRELTVDKAAELLRGRAGSTVKLEVVPYLRSDSDAATVVEVKRAPVTVPSVEREMQESVEVDLGDGMRIAVPVGKVTINFFQESTLQEVKEALAALQMAGMRVLILDLRGNPGGLFKSAVEVAELFIPEGVLVVSQTQPHVIKDRKLTGTIRAESLNALLMPMVVLIDGDTASAAEVLAGALKDNNRAKLIGQTTFGKGTIQCIIPLDKPHFERMPAGIRITVAKLLSPSWQPYSGKGVQPHFVSLLEGNAILDEARAALVEEVLKSLRAASMSN